MKTSQFLLLSSLLFSIHFSYGQGTINIIPAPEETDLNEKTFCMENLTFYSEVPLLDKLYEVIDQEFFVMTGKGLSRAESESEAGFSVNIDNKLADEEYEIEIEENIRISGGSYNAIAMASVTILQLLDQSKNSICWNQGTIRDSPEFNFRGLLLDLARRKHDIATIKRVIMLCRWYKINYLQLHLTDEHAFTFPSKAYPQLSTEGWVYTREELTDLISFADDRGVELIPELEVPGHAGQFVQKMPEVFGFGNAEIHPYTIHMGRERVYQVLDTLIGEIAELFHSSEYIHIGGDEADFSNMEEDPEIKEFLQQNNLENMEELYWHFLNKMNTTIKKHNKKTIVWEGFSKEGNAVLDKDITVMAWESLYQLPQDILEAGYKTINVSWKPLYVVNERKWSPEEIYNWNIYRWENWVPSIPSYDPIQLAHHPGIIGSSMASWDQPEYVEISSLRKRIPAMAEEVWNHTNKVPFEEFQKRLKTIDKKFDDYLSPANIKVEGLSYPDIEDGHKNEQTWFDDKLKVSFSNNRNLQIRYSLDGSNVTDTSVVYTGPIILDETAELRYGTFKNGKLIGAEMLEYFELRPLKIDMKGNFTVPLDELWNTTHPHLIKFQDKVTIFISSGRDGEIKYAIGGEELTNESKIYTSPIEINKDAFLKAGLFVDGEMIGEIWSQHFQIE